MKGFDAKRTRTKREEDYVFPGSLTQLHVLANSMQALPSVSYQTRQIAASEDELGRGSGG